MQYGFYQQEQDSYFNGNISHIIFCLGENRFYKPLILINNEIKI